MEKTRQPQKLIILKEDVWRLTRLDDDNLVALVRALLNNLECGCEPKFDDKLLPYVYEDLKRASFNNEGKATESDTSSTNTVPEPDESKVNGVPNIICTREDYEKVMKELKHNSSLFRKNERKLLRDILRRNRGRDESKQSEPLLYTSTMAQEINVGKNIIYPLRETLSSQCIMGWKQVFNINRKTGEVYPLNYYYIDEPKLVRLVHENVELDEQNKQIDQLEDLCEDQDDVVVEQKNPNAELVYSSVTGPADNLPKLTSTEAHMLYWINEASKNRSFKEGIGKKGEFVCPVKYLGKYINGALIVPTRKNLADKGYINFYMAPHTSYYVYKILVFPEYLKNKAS